MGCLDQQHLHHQVEDYSDLIHPLRLILQVVASLVDQNQLSKILLEDCLEQLSNRTLHLLAVGCLDQPQLLEAAYLAPLLSQQAVVSLDKPHNQTKEMQEVYLDSLQHLHLSGLNKVIFRLPLKGCVYNLFVFRVTIKIRAGGKLLAGSLSVVEDSSSIRSGS